MTPGQTMKIGFVGLGRMGGRMARHLISAGHQVRVYDMRPEAIAPMVALGAEAASSPADAARGADLAFTSLPGPADVMDAVMGEGGIAAGLPKGAVFADLSTVSPETSRELHETLLKQGINALDCPVSGGTKGAAAGNLCIMVGGDKEAFDRARPALDLIGDPQKVLYCGPAGAGTVCKIVNNLIGMSVRVVLAEAFTMGVKAGVSPSTIFEAVAKSSGDTAAMRQWKGGLLERNFEPGFALELAAKDVRLATDLARRMRLPMALSNYVDQQFIEALERGWGGEDSVAVVKLQEERAGVEIDDSL